MSSNGPEVPTTAWVMSSQSGSPTRYLVADNLVVIGYEASQGWLYTMYEFATFYDAQRFTIHETEYAEMIGGSLIVGPMHIPDRILRSWIESLALHLECSPLMDDIFKVVLSAGVGVSPVART